MQMPNRQHSIDKLEEFGQITTECPAAISFPA